MKIVFRKSFYKDYSKLDIRKQTKVDATITLFGLDPRNPSLRLHQLKGKYAQFHSISAGGDLRLHFTLEFIDQEIAIMVAVGTHAQLYE